MKRLPPTHRITMFGPSVNFSATSVELVWQSKRLEVSVLFMCMRDWNSRRCYSQLDCLFVALPKEVETMVVKKENRKASLSFLIRAWCFGGWKVWAPIPSDFSFACSLAQKSCPFSSCSTTTTTTLAQSKRRTHKMNAIYLTDRSFRWPTIALY